MRIPPNLRALLALLLALALVAAACGDDGDATTADEDSEDEPEPEPDDDGEGEGEGADPPDDGDDDMDEPSGADVDAYCALSAQQTDEEDTISFTTSTPEELEAYFTESQERLREAIGLAPDDIKQDLQLTLQQIEAFAGILTANNWDVFASIDELDAIADDAEMDAVDDRLAAFDLDVCGIDPGSDDGDGGEADDEGTDDPLGDDPFSSPDAFEAILGTEFGRQAFAEGMAEAGDIDLEQATCLIDQLDFETLFLLGVGEGQPSAEDTTALFAAFDACGITPDQLLG